MQSGNDSSSASALSRDESFWIPVEFSSGSESQTSSKGARQPRVISVRTVPTNSILTSRLPYPLPLESGSDLYVADTLSSAALRPHLSLPTYFPRSVAVEEQFLSHPHLESLAEPSQPSSILELRDARLQHSADQPIPGSTTRSSIEQTPDLLTTFHLETGIPVAILKNLEQSGVLAQIPRNDEGELSSIGSFTHPEGCAPCLFWFKGMCTKSIQCKYCHFRHSGQKNKRIRPSKRTRRKLRENHEGGDDDDDSVNGFQ